MTLVIGNKNYSSWSLRPWLVLRHFNIPFEEIRVPLYREDSTEKLNELSPSRLVPVLKHGDVTVWDSLAICEYVNELFPQYKLWPANLASRARARSISAEMHSGFSALRHHMSMNCRSVFPGKGLNAESQADIDRICSIWNQCRQVHKSQGNMLFGHFTIADAMYAPVAIRFKTYEVKLDPVCQEYANTLLQMPAMQEWIEAARHETEVLEKFEPYAKKS